MKKEVVFPKSITSLCDLDVWIDSFDTPTTKLDITIRRNDYKPFHFTKLGNNKIKYLVNDGSSSGVCSIRSLGDVFKFEIVDK